MNEPAIRIQGVHKWFGAIHAVDALDLEVPRGSLCGFLGPNGAGKSTTIRMIMSIIYPDQGRIDVLGGNAMHAKDRIGYLPEERGLYRKMRVRDFLAYVARLKGLRGDIRSLVTRWLERVELPDVARKRCQELSKGMQQKVQFIAAVIHEPDLLILDEPFSGLDPVNAALLSRLLGELHAAGTTVVFSTHVLTQAEQLCDRIFLINRGRKLLDDSLESIRRRFDPRTIVVHPLLPDGASLSATAGVAAVRATGADGAIELEFEDDVNPQRIMQDVLGAVPVRSIELRRVTLDEVFVRLVMQDQGRAAAELAREELRHA